MGDFVVKRADGAFAYQLAVVVDDVEMGITDVVRGADLVSSTPRQIWLARELGAAPPRYAHVPVVLSPEGARIEKRTPRATIRALREGGTQAAAIVGVLAHGLGLATTPAPATPAAVARASEDPPRVPWRRATVAHALRLTRVPPSGGYLASHASRIFGETRTGSRTALGSLRPPRRTRGGRRGARVDRDVGLEEAPGARRRAAGE